MSAVAERGIYFENRYAGVGKSSSSRLHLRLQDVGERYRIGDTGKVDSPLRIVILMDRLKPRFGKFLGPYDTFYCPVYGLSCTVFERGQLELRGRSRLRTLSKKDCRHLCPP